MKICFLADINNYHTKKWCDYFLKNGYEIVIISFTKGEIAGCKSYCFDFSNVKKISNIRKVLYLKKLFKIKKILKAEKPDILHSHYASSYGLIGTLIGYKPHVVSLWGSDILIFPRNGYIQQKIIKKVLNSDAHIFSTSNYMINEAVKYLNSNKEIHLTPFGIDVNLFKPMEKSIQNNKFIIGINKSLEKVSGIDILIKAFSNFLKNNDSSDIELRIAGKGSERLSLMNLIKDLNIEDNVVLIDYLEQSEMVEFLQKLDIAVYPSLSESFGVAAVEAQACAIPVIASNIEGFKESTLPGITSILFETGDIGDLQKKLQYLFDNKNERINMGLKGVEFVRGNFNIEDNFGDVAKIYKKLKV